MRIHPLALAPWLAIGTVVLIGAGIVAAGNGRQFRASLSGDEEVPVRVTNASGHANFKLSKEGDELEFKLVVEDIENVVQAHIHIGPPGENGPVTVFLYGVVPAAGGPIEGKISEGTITSGDLIGPLAGMTLDDLLDEMRSGNAYVNVHTNDGDDVINEGPGDFPGGEIRGQIDTN